MVSTILSLSFWKKLDDIDKWLFLKVNSGFTNPVFDAVFPYLRDSVFWTPLYVFIFVFVTINFGRSGLLWFIAFLCTVAIADLSGTYLLKQNFQRLRPCQDPDFYGQVRLLLKHCSASYSFISNHAANHFGLATFMVLTFKSIFPRWIFIFYVWAFFIAYAQVYVGVHYPFDVLAGAIVGLAAGWITATVYRRHIVHFR